jgi:hypothetical protein
VAEGMAHSQLREAGTAQRQGQGTHQVRSRNHRAVDTSACLLMRAAPGGALVAMRVCVEGGPSSCEVAAPISRSAASMTAAPLSMVAMRISCPGQSTKDTCRINRHVRPSSSNTSGVDDPLALHTHTHAHAAPASASHRPDGGEGAPRARQQEPSDACRVAGQGLQS